MRVKSNITTLCIEFYIRLILRHYTWLFMRMEFVLVGVLVHLYNTINTNTGFLYYSAYLRSQMQSCFKGKLISLTSLS